MRCQITLKPHMPSGKVESLDVTYVLDGCQHKCGEEICRAQLEAVSIPGCPPVTMQITDAQGEVPLEISHSEPYPYKLRHYTAQRDTEGTLTIAYTVVPRPLGSQDKCGPYFDMRAEEGGANTAGLSILVAMEGCKGDISLHWDTSDMPEGSCGVCSMGEGDVQYEGSLEQLRQSYFAFGRVQSLTNGDFGFYWLAKPAFDVKAIADYAQKLFGKLSKFFRDDKTNYRIFMRKDPYNHSGGTALTRSYMFGWNDTETVTVEEKQNLLAHEMVHNWPHLNDHPFGSTSWYSEGTAEYYCVMLPYRMGLVSAETTLREIQRRTDDYYTNPTRHMENMEAAKICWVDRRAQRLPYGRGFFLLGNTDVKIRKATGGKYGIDDVVLAIQEKDRAGVTLGNQVFLDTVKELSGLDVTADWELMRTGGHIVPLAGSFDGLFNVEPKEMPEADTGVTVTSYAWSLK